MIKHAVFGNSKSRVFAFLFGVIVLALIVMSVGRKGKQTLNTLKVGCPTYWGSLVPALQHTAYADALLSNQYEGLVKEGGGGAILPGLAKSWEISPDLSTYRFKLDVKRRFSNGEHLSAKTVKAAWEHGLSLPSESSNSSLQDVLYLVKGFEQFRETKTLSGLIVLDEETIQVEFKKPFRTALSEFATGRMSIYIPSNDGAVGTGPYVIDQRNEAQLLMLKNKFYQGSVSFDRVEVRVVPPESINDALNSGQIDVYAFADRAALESCESKYVSCFVGMESGHSIVIPNGLAGRIFEDSKHRLALQYLIHKNLNKDRMPGNYRRNLDIDPQVYLKLQPGRLDNDRVGLALAQGERYVEGLIAATQKNPIYLVTSEMNNWVQELLEEAGLAFTETSGVVESKDRIRMYYKTFEPDLFVSGTSIASGDPDGLFHILAKDGAITSPVLFRKKVSDLLDAGRALTDLTLLDAFYSKVSEAVLFEVPFVHIGFIRGLLAYNPTRVQIQPGFRQRESNQFTLFSPK